MEGKAPTEGLEKNFSAFKKWLTGIYKTIANIRCLDADGNWQQGQLSDDVRAPFDSVLAFDEVVQLLQSDRFDLCKKTYSAIASLASA